MAKRSGRLGDMLVEEGVITEEQLSAALERQRLLGKKRLGEILLESGLITEAKLVEVLSRQLGIPSISLSKYRPDLEVLRAVPEELARKYRVVPLFRTDSGDIAVAVEDPLNVLAMDELRLILGVDLKVFIAPSSEVRRALDVFYGLLRVQKSLPEGSSPRAGGWEGGVISLQEMSGEDAPAVGILNSILEEALRNRASDVHIEPQEGYCRIRARVDGTLYDIMQVPLNVHPALVSRVKVLGRMDIAERRLPQDGRVVVDVGGKQVDVRISTMPTIFGEKLVMRLLDRGGFEPDLKAIGMGHQEMALVEDVLRFPYGMILISGPTGSGKTTTAYAMLKRLNSPEVNIISVEDPVEYVIEGCNQVQVNERAGLTFAEVLRSILRQDPDKIFIGEMRDTETAELGIRAALTGHLVISTIHTNDAPSVPLRLMDMGVQPFLVAASLTLVVAQRLVRRLCPSCKRAYEVSTELSRATGLPAGSVVYAPVGCPECGFVGYRGRTGIFEVMPVSQELREIIIRGSNYAALKEKALEMGMRPLREAGLEKVLQGITSLEEVLQETLV